MADSASTCGSVLLSHKTRHNHAAAQIEWRNGLDDSSATPPCLAFPRGRPDLPPVLVIETCAPPPENRENPAHNPRLLRRPASRHERHGPWQSFAYPPAD